MHDHRSYSEIEDAAAKSWPYSFNAFLRNREATEDASGDFVRTCLHDPVAAWADHWDQLHSHMIKLSASAKSLDAAERVWREYEESLGLNGPIRAAEDRMIERCAQVADRLADARADELRLRGGEMTAQEIRTVRAFLKAVAFDIRSKKL